MLKTTDIIVQKLKQMKLKPGLTVFYAIQSGNTAGLFYSSRSPPRAKIHRDDYMVSRIAFVHLLM